MNLVIDLGNNFFKLGIFNNSDLIYNFHSKNDSIESEILKILSEYEFINHVLISNVSKININHLFKNINLKLYNLSSDLSLPFKISYVNQKLLGNDRIALAAAAVKFYPNSNSLIIDAGTCITIDVINQNNIFLGGSISPGINMRYKSLKNQTANLPELEMSDEFNFPGDSTIASIHSGVVGGVCHEIKGIINKINSDYDNLNIILTGGDAKFLSKTLKIPIFANQFFILHGLNSIINLNKQ
tara:strand:+ start:117 stop:842 length:726 start_codon:yes stop_codon:yes gene_type:complete